MNDRNNVHSCLLTDRSAFAKRKPGIRFTEKMIGTFTEKQKGETTCEFIVTIESQDVESMLKCDPSHTANISGTVTCPALSDAPMTITEGNKRLQIVQLIIFCFSQSTGYIC